MEITLRNVKQWARLGPRGVFGLAILDVAANYPDMMVMSADLASSSGLERFKNTYPNQFLNAGIAEQNMIGVASGLAKEGFNVFASSFSPFIAMRASEQVRMNLGYMHMNVKAVAIGSGIGMGFLGNSHFGLEDVSVMRAIPGLTIVNPADCAEVVKTIKAAAEFKGPMYIRLTGTANSPIVYEDEYEFTIGKSITLRQGSDVTLIACGSMVYEALQAANMLSEQGIEAEVVNMHTIKPLDTTSVDNAIASGKPIITIEEHTTLGGLGSSVAEYMSPLERRVRHLLIGLPDAYIKTGDYQYMLKDQQLDAESLAVRIKAFVG
ncbi:transketolase family protein [Pseudoalteromonas fenneropenaei]|uniref:Transketolase family protein n=1 Tax=Pseudoalteromonas fenneropenaei TaxID=1737459 RepID=A0ABV7CGX8_9GAMM